MGFYMDNTKVLFELLNDMSIKETLLSVIKGKLLLLIKRMPENQVTIVLEEHVDELAEHIVQCIVSAQVSFSMGDIERRLRSRLQEHLQEWLDKKIRLSSSELEESLVDNITQMVMEVLTILNSDGDVDNLNRLVVETGKLLMHEAANIALESIKDQLPAFTCKTDLLNELEFLTSNGINNFDNTDLLKEIVRDHGIKKACEVANKQISKAIDQVDLHMREFEGKAEIKSWSVV